MSILGGTRGRGEQQAGARLWCNRFVLMLSLAWVSMGGMSWPVIASLGKWSMRPGARSRAPSTVPQASLGTRPQVAPAELSNVPGHCALDVHGGKLSLKTCKRTSHGVEEPSPSTNGDPRPVVHRQGCLHRTAGTAKPCRSNPSLTSKAIPDSHPDLSPNAPCKSTSPGLLWHPGGSPRHR